MAARGDTLLNPLTGTRARIVSPPQDTGGRELVIDWFVPAGERLPAEAHYHVGPPATFFERFEVINGAASCRIGVLTRSVSAPGTLDIPANIVHTHPANEAENELHVRQIVRPHEPDLRALIGIQRYVETVIALSQREQADSAGRIINGLQRAATLSETLIDPTFLPGMPQWFQKMVFGMLARIARKRGYEAVQVPAVMDPRMRGHGRRTDGS